MLIQTMTWYDCRGKPCPRQEFVFICQCLILTVIIVVSLYNLSNTTPEECSKEALWASLISGSLGICCPGPVIKWGSKQKKDQDTYDDDVEGRLPEVGDHSDDTSEQQQYEFIPGEQGLGLQGSTSSTTDARWRLGGGTDRFQLQQDLVQCPGRWNLHPPGVSLGPEQGSMHRITPFRAL